MSGAGKSTLANALDERLHKRKIHTYVLDGDNIRNGINKNLGFSQEDRSENNRRIGEISKLFIDAGIVVLAAFIAPYKKDRAYIKQTCPRPGHHVVLRVDRQPPADLSTRPRAARGIRFPPDRRAT